MEKNKSVKSILKAEQKKHLELMNSTTDALGISIRKYMSELVSAFPAEIYRFDFQLHKEQGIPEIEVIPRYSDLTVSWSEHYSEGNKFPISAEKPRDDAETQLCLKRIGKALKLRWFTQLADGEMRNLFVEAIRF